MSFAVPPGFHARRGIRSAVPAGEATFRFRTLPEVAALSGFMSRYFPDPPRAAYGLSELMLNAVEHGNLGITYDEKKDLMFSGTWREEIEKRLLLPEHRHKFASLTYEVGEDGLKAIIRDQGLGFDWREYMELSPERAGDPNGRGIALVRLRAFPMLEFRGIGNEAVCRVPPRSSV